MTYRAFRRDRAASAPTALETAQDAFVVLVAEPAPLAVDGRAFVGLPDRAVALDELRELLPLAEGDQATRDAVWAHLVRRSHVDGPAWTVGCVGVALPELTAIAVRLTKRFRGDPGDIHNAVLSGFLAALAASDPDRPHLPTHLWWAAYRTGHTALREAYSAPTLTEPDLVSRPPVPPWGHADFVLARAIADGILTPTEADVIGATRLEDRPIADWAAARDLGYWTAYRARARAEQRLLAYLSDAAADADPDDRLTPHVVTTATVRRATTDRSTPTPPHSGRSLSVSGRLRNGRHPRPEKTRASVFKTGPKSGVKGRGATTPTPRHPPPPTTRATHPPAADSSEVRRCA